MNCKACSSEPTDKEWMVLKRFIHRTKSGGRPRTTNIREVLSTIFTCHVVIESSDCCRMTFQPSRPSIITSAAVWEQIYTTLHERTRVQAIRESQPSASIIDSLSAKTTERGGVLGVEGGKKISDHRRHTLSGFGPTDV